VGRAGNPRHQFRGRRGHEIRSQALVIGTTVKLARALWIVPLALLSRRSSEAARKNFRGAANGVARVQFPVVYVFFVLAALANTYLPALLRLPKHFSRWADWAHSDIVSDWERISRTL